MVRQSIVSSTLTKKSFSLDTLLHKKYYDAFWHTDQTVKISPFFSTILGNYIESSF